MKNRKHILEALQHFIVGFFLAAEGYSKITEHDPVIGGIVLALGIVLLLYFTYDLATKRESLRLKVMAHLFEGVALGFTTYIFFREHTVYIKWVNLFACVAMFASAVILLRKGDKQ
ncbi:MAG TPA: hypothetical protein VMF29_09490 [Candidatus Edwardsbacteria bacterium]|nr:hypothetical protein [Candidatus Edwardsbacteria bacterium]